MLFERMTRAQSLSINTIIIVVLGLLVLVVIGFIGSSQFRNFSTTTSQCEGVGKADRVQCNNLGAPIPMKGCDDNGDRRPEVEGDGWCCKSVG